MSNARSVLHLKVRDMATGQLLPARFHIKRKDGSPYVPSSQETTAGRRAPQIITAADFVKNLHLCQGNDIRSSHLACGEAIIPVPAGQLTIHVARGFTYAPFSRTFVAKPGKETHLECKVSSIQKVCDSGWYSGDMHVHFTRRSKRDDSILAHLMAAEDLLAVNNMVYKDRGRLEAHQRTMGHESTHYRLSHHHQVISGGEEFRDDDLYGHMIAAGIKKRIEPVSVGQRLGRRENYPLFSQVCDWTHEQHGIAGWAHGAAQIKLHESLPIEAALRKLDFIEGIQFNQFMGFYFWYRLLNCGLRLSMTGGSDFPFHSDILAPWYLNLGLGRTYVHLGDAYEFSYDSYLEGIRAGRSFSTNGPMLFFQVNGHGPGSTIGLPSHTNKIRIRVRALCQYPLDRVEIIVNGAVQHMVHGKGGSREVACETDLDIRESAWLAARVRGTVEPKVYGGAVSWNLHAHSSPIYIRKDSRPIVQKADATWMADYVRFIAEMYRQRGVFKKEHQREALLRNVRKAVRFYERLLK